MLPSPSVRTPNSLLNPFLITPFLTLLYSLLPYLTFLAPLSIFPFSLSFPVPLHPLSFPYPLLTKTLLLLPPPFSSPTLLQPYVNHPKLYFTNLRYTHTCPCTWTVCSFLAPLQRSPFIPLLTLTKPSPILSLPFFPCFTVSNPTQNNIQTLTPTPLLTHNSQHSNVYSLFVCSTSSVLNPLPLRPPTPILTQPTPYLPLKTTLFSNPKNITLTLTLLTLTLKNTANPNLNVCSCP